MCKRSKLSLPDENVLWQATTTYSLVVAISCRISLTVSDNDALAWGQHKFLPKSCSFCIHLPRYLALYTCYTVLSINVDRMTLSFCLSASVEHRTDHGLILYWQIPCQKTLSPYTNQRIHFFLVLVYVANVRLVCVEFVCIPLYQTSKYMDCKVIELKSASHHVKLTVPWMVQSIHPTTKCLSNRCSHLSNVCSKYHQIYFPCIT